MSVATEMRFYSRFLRGVPAAAIAAVAVISGFFLIHEPARASLIQCIPLYHNRHI